MCSKVAGWRGSIANLSQVKICGKIQCEAHLIKTEY